MGRRMTQDEKDIKNWLISVLANGHKIFAKHFIQYDFHLTENPKIVACVHPNTGVIEINKYFDELFTDGKLDPESSDAVDLLSALLRHELMHLLLRHEQNAVKWIAPDFGLDPHHMKKSDYRMLLQELYTRKFVPTLSADEDGNLKYGLATIMNFAGDWDLSRYYTERDKDLIKTTIGGMILELDHPEMKDMNYFDLLNEISRWEREYRRAAMEIIEGELSNDKKDFKADDADDAEEEDIK